MKIRYELFDDLHTGSDYRITTILTLDKDEEEWALYLIYYPMYSDPEGTNELRIDEEIAHKLLKETHISSVEVIKE